MVNLLARVFDKTGAPVTPFFKLSSLFAPLGGVCWADAGGGRVMGVAELSAALGMAMRNRSSGLFDTFERALALDPSNADAQAVLGCVASTYAPGR